MIRLACILAAGCGTRLGGLEYPKGFLELGGRTLIEASLDRLLEAGIERVVAVTGHGAEYYLRLAERRSEITCVHNPAYADSGSLYSLWCAREHLKQDFLLLESDLAYESRALTCLQQFPEKDGILLSGPTGAGDEVYVETRDGQLKGMSKQRKELGPVAGELVGICRISADLLQELCCWGEARFHQHLHWDYETDGLVGCAQNRDVACLTINDLIWTEIDDAAHWERAQRLIGPALGYGHSKGGFSSLGA